MSLANHSAKLSWESNSLGMMKWRRAQSSLMVFWIGVPESKSLFLALSCKRVFHHWEVNDLIAWASSRIIWYHMTLCSLSSVITRLYEVMQTWNGEYSWPKCFWLKNFLRFFLSFPQYGSTLKLGQNWLSSFFQLNRVVAGATTKNGPQMFLFSERWARREIAWMVFPSPISSARIPLILCISKESSHLSPFSWYSFSFPLKETGALKMFEMEVSAVSSLAELLNSVALCWLSSIIA